MNKKKSLLNFLIVGAAKSGTTSLYYYLNQHPQIFMPQNKEPFFFCLEDDLLIDKTLGKRFNLVSQEQDYWELFSQAQKDQCKGEASTGYLYLYGQTIEKIKHLVPAWQDLKIIIIIRNPADRAYSHYLTDRASGLIRDNFGTIIEQCLSDRIGIVDNIISYGMYFVQIEAYRQAFESVKVVRFEDLKKRPRELIQELYAFLGVKTTFQPDVDVRYNVSTEKNWLVTLIYKDNIIKKCSQACIPRRIREKTKNFLFDHVFKKPILDSKTRQCLIDIYFDDIIRLQQLIGMDLKRWTTL